MNDLWKDVLDPQDPDHYDKAALEWLFPTLLPILNNLTGLKWCQAADDDNPKPAVTSLIDYQSHKQLRTAATPQNPLGITTQNPAPGTTWSVITDPFINGIFVDQIIFLEGPLELVWPHSGGS